ncbi:MAG: DEAD/DEAH box helicase family protein [Planctomycetales bacterium]|nr:DEAD/DEAH box helicase family protein [Planctomycetales bacterium]
MESVSAESVGVFPSLRFQGELRPSQREVVEIARRKLATGQERLHIVAPPGSGKTVLGLYLWAECIRRPALVLSPNSAIQAQWAARAELFGLEAVGGEAVSTDPEQPGLLTSLTYQSVTLPSRGSAELDQVALEVWQERLIAKGQAESPEEAEVWLADLRRHNSAYYESRLSAYRKQVRDQRAIGGEALATLHASALDTLGRLKQRGVGLIILDECHHLLGHWGRVLADAQQFLDHPMVVGLTATPPDRDGKPLEDVERYDAYFGEVDFEVPLPAVVKDGFLAPYQDLAYFVRPTGDELSFVANADDELHQLVAELCENSEADRTGGLANNAGAAGSRPMVSEPDEPETTILIDDSQSPPVRGRGKAKDGGKGKRSRGDRTVASTEPMPDWTLRVLGELLLPTGPVEDWKKFERRDPQFSMASRLFLLRRRIALPEQVPEPAIDLAPEEVPEMEVLVPVLDRYVRHHLRRSARAEDRQLAERVVARLRMLGVQITETGCQACASPVGRVMAYSRGKTAAVPRILQVEYESRGDALRAIVVADYEKSSAVTAGVDHLLDEEAGGAVAAFKALLNDPLGNRLDPILITGSSVLIDDDMAPRFEQAATAWLRENGYEVELTFGVESGFHVINGRGADWCPRVYVEMITELFQRGLTRCLVGTRGLLGEGWDANKVNVLVDLTTVTTSMTVNQLRGRSIRLDPAEPEKLANNWDVVCIAPEFSKGLDDYRRFIAKHQTIYGVTEDGAIEKGVGHVHAAFTELRPELLESSVQALNDEMLARARQREVMRGLWRIGQPYRNQPIRAIETRSLAGGSGGFPPFSGSSEPWNARSLALAIGQAILMACADLKLVRELPPIQTGERAGGYVRVFLDTADDEASQVFTEALHDALGPLHRPRYVIPRYVDRVTAARLARWLPKFIGRWFERRDRETAMLHAVPRLFAKNAETVAVYQRRWNEFVSPGEAIYALRGAGETLARDAVRNRRTPSSEIHEKEVFL